MFNMFTAFQKPITRWGSKRTLQFENSWYGCSGSESIQVGEIMSSEQSKKSVNIVPYVLMICTKNLQILNNLRHNFPIFDLYS